MKRHIYVRPGAAWIKGDELDNCAHEHIEIIEFTLQYVTYDGPEEFTSVGNACTECGLVIDGRSAEDRVAVISEDKLIKLLGKK